jgi:hypothetical protein
VRLLEWSAMRVRVGAALVAATVGIGIAVGTPGAAVAAAGQRVCRVADRRMTELSGMVATKSGYIVVNDGSDDPAARQIFYLDQSCAVTRTVKYPSRPRDTEDMGLAGDGTLWVADIGDNDSNRDSIGLWRLPAGARKPQLFRLKYPDGPHDAEALLIAPNGTLIVVTKTIGSAGVYEPAAGLRANKTTALRKAGELTLPLTNTPDPFSFAGRFVVTGGAVSPDGRHAVLRTYADGFEFDVEGGDVVGAITKGRPRQIAMPNEPQGESVAYTPDGTALVTVSEGAKPEVLRYALPARPAAATSAPPPPSATAPSKARTQEAQTRKALQERAEENRISAGAIVAGSVLILAAVVLIGILVARRGRRGDR